MRKRAEESGRIHTSVCLWFWLKGWSWGTEAVAWALEFGSPSFRGSARREKNIGSKIQIEWDYENIRDSDKPEKGEEISRYMEVRRKTDRRQRDKGLAKLGHHHGEAAASVQGWDLDRVASRVGEQWRRRSRGPEQSQGAVFEA